MIGTVRWNFVLGAIGFAATFFMSVGDNFLRTTLLNSAYSFAILFAVGFAVRWWLGTVVGLKNARSTTENEKETEHRGAAVDAVTPDEQEQLNRLLKEQLAPPVSESEFVPLQPKRLTSHAPNDPKRMAEALRRLTDN
jgi:hypothetical protein